MEKYPKIIYKYRDWDNGYHKKLLKNNELYTPSISEINDPFDCLIQFNYDALHDGFSARDIDIMYKEFGNQLDALGYNPLKLLRINDITEIANVIKLKKQNDQKFINNRKRHLGVASFSEYWNIILMWSHYSNSHKGFCIGFDTQKLIESSYFNNGCKVFYTKNYPSVDPFEELNEKTVKVFYHKDKSWEYEQEYRMTKFFGYHRNECEFKKQKKIYFDDNCVSEVVLGLKIDPENQKEILRICDLKAIPVYKIISESKSFILKRKKII